MDVSFKTAALRKCCENDRTMQRKLGPDGARKLRARLADLRAASSMAEIRRGRPHPLIGKLGGCLALDLDGGRRLVIEPAKDAPQRDDGNTDWGAVEFGTHCLHRGLP